jgi:hypothetical protein
MQDGRQSYSIYGGVLEKGAHWRGAHGDTCFALLLLSLVPASRRPASAQPPSPTPGPRPWAPSSAKPFHSWPRRGLCAQVLGLLGVKQEPKTGRIMLTTDPYDALLAVGQVRRPRSCTMYIEHWVQHPTVLSGPRLALRSSFPQGRPPKHAQAKPCLRLCLRPRQVSLNVAAAASAGAGAPGSSGPGEGEGEDKKMPGDTFAVQLGWDWKAAREWWARFVFGKTYVERRSIFTMYRCVCSLRFAASRRGVGSRAGGQDVALGGHGA